MTKDELDKLLKIINENPAEIQLPRIEDKKLLDTYQVGFLNGYANLRMKIKRLFIPQGG